MDGMHPGIKSVYLAGPIAPWDWRLLPVQGMRHDLWANTARADDSSNAASPFPVLRNAIFGRYDYTGPFYPLDSEPRAYGLCPSSVTMWCYRKNIQDADVAAEQLLGRYRRCCLDAIARSDLVVGCFLDQDGEDNSDSQFWIAAAELCVASRLGKHIAAIGTIPERCAILESRIFDCGVHYGGTPRGCLSALFGDVDLLADAGHGFVYFIEQPAIGQIKIGWAKNPHERLKTFQTASSHKLQLLGMIPGSRTLERKLHQDFSHYRFRGEWFYGVEPLRELIRLEAHLPD